MDAGIRQKLWAKMRLEGKDYIVKDGDIVYSLDSIRDQILLILNTF